MKIKENDQSFSDIYLSDEEDLASNIVVIGTKAVEFLSKDEIYLLGDNNKRLKRICGYKKSNDGNPCETKAGLYTSHRDFGRCKQHHGTKSTQSNMLLRFLQMKNRTEGNFVSYIDAFKDMSDEDAENFIPLIKIQNALIARYTKKYNNNWNDKTSLFLSSMVSDLSNLIEKSIRSKRAVVLTPKLLDGFFAVIVEVLTSFVGEEIAKNTIRDIMKKMSFPVATVIDGDLTEGKFKEIQKSEVSAPHLLKIGEVEKK